MERWTAISKKELQALIEQEEQKLVGVFLNFWQLIRVPLQKWVLSPEGDKGVGFWVVAIFGQQVIWYNDIEEGFNISEYKTHGEIEEYGGEQDQINWVIYKIYNHIEKLNHNEVGDSYLYFAFKGDYFDTNAITELLRIQPTSVKVKNSPIPKSTTWSYQIEMGSVIDFETYIHDLLNIFESRIERINQLKNELQLTTILQFVIEIDTNPNISTPYFGLNQRATNFLCQTATDVDYDLYKV